MAMTMQAATVEWFGQGMALVAGAWMHVGIGLQPRAVPEFPA